MTDEQPQLKPTGKYLLWSDCPENVEAYDDKDEAFGMAWAIANGDYGIVTAIEGPNGEDLMAEFETYDREKSHQQYEEIQARPKATHRIKALSPSWKRPTWVTVDWVCANQNPETVAAEYIELLGADRVKIEEYRGR